MTNMLGNDRIVYDTDALIALVNVGDSLHKRALGILKHIESEGFVSIIPYAIVLEAATALAKDKGILRSDLAHEVLRQYVNFPMTTGVDLDVGGLVAQIYDPETSKKNSPFDHYVLALAIKNKVKYIFSFDSFYSKNGLKLIEEIL